MSGSPSSTPPAGFSCPQKGAFYVCAESAVRFVGCCASDPCANGGVCADGDLAPAAFSADSYAVIPPQNCSGSGGAAAAADWYTCKSTSPPFLGCCVSDPCKAAAPGGCPRADLGAARLADDEVLAGPFLGSSSSSSSSSSSTPSSPSRTSTSAVSTASGTASAPRPSEQATTSSSSSFSVGAVAGVAVGGCALLAIIGVLAWRLLRQRRRARTAAVQGDQMTVARGPGIPPSQPSPPYSPYKGSFTSSPTVVGYSPSSPPTAVWSPQSPSEGWTSPGPGHAASMRPLSELAGSEIGYNDLSVRGTSVR